MRGRRGRRGPAAVPLSMPVPLRVLSKARSKSGMTLVETLAALLLTALATAVLLAGTQTAFQVYAKNTFLADSQTVSDTILTAFSDVLRYAEAVDTDAAGQVTAYSCSSYGLAGENITVGGGAAVGEGRLFLDRAQTVPLLSDLSYSGMEVSDFLLQYEDGVFTCSYRLRDKTHSLTSDLFTFSLRTLSV